MNIILFATPIFFLLIAAELIGKKVKNKLLLPKRRDY
jgi:hypothetical protein